MQMFKTYDRSSSGVVVISSYLVEQEVWRSIPALLTTNSEIGFLLLPSRDMAERSLFKAT